ncbi:MAG: class I SAM-dependent methyltransferase [Caldilineaceae bacterium]
MKWRKNLVGNLTGAVLEIGVGRGENLPYYAPSVQVWAIEPDPTRAAQAQQVAATCRPAITVDVTGAESLPYADHTFDHVVSSLVFCSVANPRVALAEIRRVLKPQGTLHMVEHIRPETQWLATLFRLLTPRWRQIAHNCHLDRPTLQLLQGAGATVTVRRRIFMFVRLEVTFPAIGGK